MKCSNRSGSLFKVIDKVNEMIEKHIKSIEVEINSVDTKRMLEILEKIISGEGTLEDLNMLQDLGNTITKTALCGLGKSAANPVISTIKHFRDEYISHIVDKKCPAGTCSKLKVFCIDKEKCKGCSKCSRVCPVNAIIGKIKEPFVIDTNKCIKCGACKHSCSFGAIIEM